MNTRLKQLLFKHRFTIGLLYSAGIFVILVTSWGFLLTFPTFGSSGYFPALPAWIVFQLGISMGHALRLSDPEWAFDLIMSVPFIVSSVYAYQRFRSAWRVVQVQSLLVGYVPVTIYFLQPDAFQVHVAMILVPLGLSWLTNQVLLGLCGVSLLISTIMVRLK
jgi:hypothetical protein